MNAPRAAVTARAARRRGTRRRTFRRLAAAARAVRAELSAWRLLLADPRTPWLARVLLAVAVGYALMPFDLIPDFIPVLGLLDDLLLVGGCALLAVSLIPREALADCRLRAARAAVPER